MAGEGVAVCGFIDSKLTRTGRKECRYGIATNRNKQLLRYVDNRAY